jgi:hypothetical protein
MNVVFKALKFGIFNLVTLKMLYKSGKVWNIAYSDFCKLDKYTKTILLEAGVKVI